MKKTKSGLPKILAFIALTLLLPLTVILTNAAEISFEKSFYHNEFKKIGTYDRVSNADDILDNILNFFNNREELNYFSQDETSHMQDVKKIISAFSITHLILLLAITGLIFYLKNLNLIFYAFITSFALLIILTILIQFIDFSSLFTSFHNLLFKPGTWTFSQNDLLIKLFPIQFFQDIAKTIWLSSLYQLLIPVLAMFVLKKSIRL